MPRLFLIILGVALLPHLAIAEGTRIQGLTMGTSYSITIPQKLEPAKTRELSGKIRALFESFSHEFSTYDPTSAISGFNQDTSTDPIPVSSQFAKLVLLSTKLATKTKGAFDPTVEPLLAVWGFGHGQSRNSIPSQSEIDVARSKIGVDKLTIKREPPSLRKTIPDLHLDLSALAKGYGVDEVGRLLEAEGYSNYLVEIGGEIRARGRNPRGDFWRIGIAVPDDTRTELETIVALENTSIATSGDYQKYIEIDGNRIAHIIDPRTGRPIVHQLASATVLHVDCAVADAYATALMVVGSDAAKIMAETLAVPVLLIIRDGANFIPWTSKNWTHQVQD